MDLKTAVYGRRAIRAYTTELVAQETIAQLIEAAIQAPSSMDLEPWAFAIVEGAARLKEFSERAKAAFLTHTAPQPLEARMHEMLADPDFNIFHDASTLVVVCAPSDEPQAAEDCCLAAQTLMLAAHAAGLGTCPIGFSRPWLRLPETKSELGIAAAYVPIFPVVVGHPAEQPAAPGRKSPLIIRSLA
jgi:nitroreductase